MANRRIFCLLALMSLFVFAAIAADVNGKWKAEMPGPGGQTREVTFTFKAEGEKLTGSVSTPRGERDISEGKISGDDISFVMVQKRKDAGEVKIIYKGKVSGNEIKFTMGPEGAQGREFTAKKAE